MLLLLLLRCLHHVCVQAEPLDALVHRLLGYCMAAVAVSVLLQGATVSVRVVGASRHFGLNAAKSLALIMQVCLPNQWVVCSVAAGWLEACRHVAGGVHPATLVVLLLCAQLTDPLLACPLLRLLLSPLLLLLILLQGCWFLAITHIMFSTDSTWHASFPGDMTRTMFTPVLFAWILLGKRLKQVSVCVCMCCCMSEAPGARLMTQQVGQIQIVGADSLLCRMQAAFAVRHVMTYFHLRLTTSRTAPFCCFFPYNRCSCCCRCADLLGHSLPGHALPAGCTAPHTQQLPVSVFLLLLATHQAAAAPALWQSAEQQ